MTITSGLGQNFFVDGFDLSGTTGSASRISSSMATLDKTAVNQEGMARLPGLHDGGLDFQTWWDAGTGLSHDALETLPTTDRTASWLFGVTLGDPTANLVAKQIGYDPTRAQDGSLSLTSSLMANQHGLDFGRNLTGDGTDGVASQGSAGSLTGFDDGSGAATNFGLSMFVHLLSFTGTSITVTLQDSDDNGTDPYATVTGATTGALTTAQGIRVRTSATENVKEWLRVTTTGTFSAATFVVSYVRYFSTRWT